VISYQISFDSAQSFNMTFYCRLTMNTYQKSSLLFISLAWLLIFVGRITPSTLLVDITGDLGISDIQAGWAFTGMWIMYGIDEHS